MVKSVQAVHILECACEVRLNVLMLLCSEMTWQLPTLRCMRCCAAAAADAGDKSIKAHSKAKKVITAFMFDSLRALARRISVSRNYSAVAIPILSYWYRPTSLLFLRSCITWAEIRRTQYKRATTQNPRRITKINAEQNNLHCTNNDKKV